MKISFNEYLLEQYGITADDMTDDDYDAFYEEYRKAGDRIDLPSNYWQPGCEDANNEPAEELWMEDEELPFD